MSHEIKIAPTPEIRRQARDILRVHWMRGLLVPFSLELLMLCVVYGLQSAFPAASTVISIIYSVVIIPMEQFIITRIALDLWDGNPTELTSLLSGFRRIVAIAVVYQIMNFVPDLVATVSVSVLGSGVFGLLITIPLALVIAVLVLLLKLRLAPTFTHLAAYPEDTLWESISYGWHYSKDFLLDIFCQDIALSLPVIVCSFIERWFFADHSLFNFLLDTLPAMLFSGYITLGMTGLFRHLFSADATIDSNKEEN